MTEVDFKVKKGFVSENGDLTLQNGNIELANGHADIDNIRIDGNTISSQDTNGAIALIPNGDGLVKINTGNSEFYLPTSDSPTAGHVITFPSSGKQTIWSAPTAGGVAADDITTGDAAINIVTTSGNITLDAQATDADIIFKVDDGNTPVTALTLDGSDAGRGIFAGNVTVTGNEVAFGNGATIVNTNANLLTITEATTAFSADVTVGGDLRINGNDIKASDGTTAITLSGANVELAGNLTVTGKTITTEVEQVSTSNGVLFEGDQLDGHDILLKAGSVSNGGQTITLPDETGTVLTSASTASALTSVGTLTALTVDNISINGSTIGHTSDTDLITLANGLLTVAGEISVTTLDIGGTNVTATATELNVLDNVTAGTVTASLGLVVDSNKDIATLNQLDSATLKAGAGVAVATGGDHIIIGDDDKTSIYSKTSASTSFSAGTATTIFTLASGTNKGVKLLIHFKQVNSPYNVHMEEMLVTWGGSSSDTSAGADADVHVVQYGLIRTDVSGAGSGTITVARSSANINVQWTSAAAENWVYKIHAVKI
jgi:hypothetical protein